MADQENLSSPATVRHRIGATGSFSLDNVSGRISLRGVDTDEVVVNARWEHGGDDRPLPLVVRRSENGLQIELDEGTGWLTVGHRGSIGFDVSVPSGARIDVKSVSSSVTARGLLGDQTYKTVSGDLEIDGAGGRLSASSVSGDVRLAGAQPLEANLSSTSGDVEASAPMFQALRFRTVSGDMNARGGFAAEPQHTVESVSGDLSIETTTGLTVDTKRGLDFSRKDHRPLVVGDGSANLRFRSLSGDVRLSGPSSAAAHVAQPQVTGADSMEILRALERGEIDVEEASRRLEGAGSRG